MKQMFQNKVLTLIGLGVATIGFAYFAPQLMASAWYLILLGLYFKSKDEPFWLVFFFMTTDGFIGFFGLYTVVLQAIPGMPPLEVAQLYILLSYVKVVLSRKKANSFYSKWMYALLLYSFFLVIYGSLAGLKGEMNVIFRIVKMLLPLLLFYTVPRLLTKMSDYEELFRLIFPVFLLAILTQLYTLYTGIIPGVLYKKVTVVLDEDDAPEIEVGKNFRSLYNSHITLLSLLGAMYFLSLKRHKVFSDMYLYLVMGMTFVMSFLSATRGWILSTGLVIMIFFVIVQKLHPKQLSRFVFLGFILLMFAFSNGKISKQIQFSVERLITLESLASGDLSAEGTLERLDERGPKVMAVWERSPILGWGFSDTFFEYADMHVANQNILMQSGVFGFMLLYSFLFFFVWRMIRRRDECTPRNQFQSTYLVFPIFLIGWLILHSSSGQQFAFYGLPHDIFPQAIFLSFAGFTFNQAKNRFDL